MIKQEKQRKTENDGVCMLKDHRNYREEAPKSQVWDYLNNKLNNGNSELQTIEPCKIPWVQTYMNEGVNQSISNK